MSARDAGEIRWLLLLARGSGRQSALAGRDRGGGGADGGVRRRVGRWGVTRQHAGGELPVPGVYGVPEQWPHIAALYRRAGFAHTGHTEVVYLAPVEDLPARAGTRPPLDGLAVSRSVGINGCRLSAVLGGEVDRLHRDRDPGPGRAAVPARRLGRRRQPACRTRVPPPRRGILAARRRPADWLRLAGVTPPAQLRLAGGHRSRRPELRRLPGVPARRGLPRADPHRARVDQE